MAGISESFINITSLNTKSIRSQLKWTQMTNFVENNNVDICLLQETNVRNEVNIPERQYKFYFNSAINDYSGTAIAIKKSQYLCVSSHDILYRSYLQKITIKLDDVKWHIFNIYIPHDINIAASIVETLKTNLSLCRNENVLIGGDFNCTLNPQLDRSGSRERYPSLVKMFQHVVQNFNLTDIWRHFNKTVGGFTFVTPGPQKTASRLDRIYCSEPALSSIAKIHLRCSFSDHLAVCAMFRLNNRQTFSPPYWRFNNHLLDDSDFVEKIGNYISCKMKNRSTDTDLLEWWDHFKSDLKYMIVLFTKQKQRIRLAEFKMMQSQIHNIMSKQHASPEKMEELSELMKRAQDYYKRSSEKLLERLGQQQLLELDQPTINKRVFQNYKPMEKLKNDGRTISGQGNLCAYIRKHFREKCSKINSPSSINKAYYTRI